MLFLDEPSMGLDVNAQVRVRSFLADYNRRTGATVLLTSHYMGDITALCERVLLIHQGRLFYDGSLEGLTDQLAPCRQVRLELRHVLPARMFESYGTLESRNGNEVRLLIERDRLTQQVGRLLADFDVCDLEVNDPPVEEIIGQLFRQRDDDEQEAAAGIAPSASAARAANTRTCWSTAPRLRYGRSRACCLSSCSASGVGPAVTTATPPPLNSHRWDWIPSPWRGIFWLCSSCASSRWCG